MTRQPQVERVYRQRFSDAEAAAKDLIWSELGRYLQRFVSRDGVVVDIACDRGGFIRNVEAREKWATDLRDVSAQLPDGVRFVQTDGLELASVLPNEYFDAAFMSNYLEHLAHSEAVVTQFEQVFRVLKPGGRVIVLQPNIRLVGGAYWDFIDHKVALTDKSLVEAGELANFRTLELKTRFLPYTTKSRFPKHRALVRAYLAFPPAWWLLGKQTLYVGARQ